MNRNVGRQLTVFRATRGLSQEALAGKLGVSRQAVSNWERSESMPDTDNLLRLAEYYAVSLDELTARAPQPEAVGDAPLESGRGKDSSRMPLLGFGLCLLVAAAYFVWAAQPLLRSSMDDITEVFGLVPGTALALAWFFGEVLFVAAPFLVMAAMPVHLPRWAWVAPVVVIASLAAPPLFNSAIGGAQLVEYSGLGGALKASVVMKADALALALACAALVVRQRTHPLHLTSASSWLPGRLRYEVKR